LNAALRGEAPDDAAALLAASRFMALATIDGQGRADVSPKGDPSGALIRLQNGVACYAERPGNRRADSFRNILVQPRIAAAALIPGAAQVAILTGTARLTTDAALRESFAVNGKTPLLATCIEGARLAVRPSAALQRARLWPAAPRPDGINPAAMFAAHVRLNKTRGLGATLARAAVSVPGLMQRGLDRDYKTNLY
jgi:predicted pyridoxine 5'-phosphate oxidase superfamily flavin-nucleotide-binding protein